MNLEESETDERDQIENPTKLNMSNNQELRYYDNLVDTDTELEHGTVNDTEEVGKSINKNVTTVIAENEQDEKSMIQNLL